MLDHDKTLRVGLFIDLGVESNPLDHVTERDLACLLGDHGNAVGVPGCKGCTLLDFTVIRDTDHRT